MIQFTLEVYTGHIRGEGMLTRSTTYNLHVSSKTKILKPTQLSDLVLTIIPEMPKEDILKLWAEYVTELSSEKVLRNMAVYEEAYCFDIRRETKEGSVTCIEVAPSPEYMSQLVLGLPDASGIPIIPTLN